MRTLHEAVVVATVRAMMRVLMTADTVGGVWTYAVELVRALGRFGVEVLLATMGGVMSEDQRREAGALGNAVVCESAFKLEWMGDPWGDVKAAGEWLTELAARFRPDVVHLNGYAHGALDWGAPVMVVGHSCVLSWWRAVKGEEAPGGEWGRYREEVTRGLRGADVVVAPSGAMLDALKRHYAPLPPSRVIYNGRSVGRFNPRVKEPFVMSAGRLWDEAKNLAALDEAVGGIDWPVYVAGEERSPDGKVVRARHVHGLGRLSSEEMGQWLGRAAVYALPARYEPFGLSVLEAGLSGCALVLGEIESLREVWGDGAVYVRPGDVAGLRGAIDQLIRDQKRRGEMGRRARERAVTYSAARMGREYFAAYSQMLDRRVPRGVDDDESRWTAAYAG